MSCYNITSLAHSLIPVVQAAGRAEMDIYNGDFSIETKDDNSPVTAADKAAEAIILEGLLSIAPDIPVVAEEAASEGKIPVVKDLFFLVDPLDGTKEFIRKSSEFTVNIGLIEKGRPVFGIVYAPALNALYVTMGAAEVKLISLAPDTPITDPASLAGTSIQTRTNDGALDVVASKSHLTQETKDFASQFNVADFKSAGSSLKFCLLAKGEADLYPRFGPTMEWDTAAGHAVLQAAGGVVTNEDGSPFLYGKTDQGFKNPFFIAWSSQKQLNTFYS